MDISNGFKEVGHVEYISLGDPSEEGDGCFWPVHLPDGYTVIKVEDLERYKKAVNESN